MTDTKLRERGAVVKSAAEMLRHGNINLDLMPSLVLRIIDEGMWEQRAIPQEGWRLSREFNNFEEFVTTGPWEGLGTTVDMLRDVCRRDVRAIDAIDRACLHEEGGDHRSEEYRTTVNNINSGRPEGTSQAQALRRLRQDRPDLHARVLNGELSAHGAMVEAGLRYRTVSVRVTDPRSAAKTLRDNMSPEDLAEMVRILSDDSGTL